MKFEGEGEKFCPGEHEDRWAFECFAFLIVLITWSWFKNLLVSGEKETLEV